MKVKGEGEQGKKFEFRVRVRERRMKESGVREVIEAVNAAKDEMPHITPDTVVECPGCGARFRVGKVLG